MKSSRPEKRFYRSFLKPKGFSFEIVAGESDVWICLPGVMQVSEGIRGEIRKTLLNVREELSYFIEKNPDFYSSLQPIKVSSLLIPDIIRVMLSASEKADVGPMAGVAGAVNFFIGKRIENFGFKEFIIENGGDVYLLSKEERVFRVYSGVEEIDRTVALKIPPGRWGVCSSSSKIGHSLSLGNSSVATVIAKDSVVADCMATAVANSKTAEEMVELSRRFVSSCAEGIFGVIDGKIVLSGNISPVKLVL